MVCGFARLFPGKKSQMVSFHQLDFSLNEKNSLNCYTVTILAELTNETKVVLEIVKQLPL